MEETSALKTLTFTSQFSLVQPYYHIFHPEYFVEVSSTHLQRTHLTCDTDEISLVQRDLRFYNVRIHIISITCDLGRRSEQC